MRKVKLQMQVSVDGYVAGPNGEMDWMTWDWDDALKNYVNALTEPVDCILLGRILADGFIPAWANAVANPETADAFAHKMVNTPKIVFSKTLVSVDWDNTELATEALAEAITQLKQAEGGDIIVYGGSNFVSNLIHEGLIDEFHLFVNPAAIGSGMPIFKERTALTFIKSQAFECGIVVLQYAPLR